MDWFFETIAAHLFLFFLVLLGMGLGMLLVRDQLLKASGLPREEWPRVFTHRTITPASNKLGFLISCACGLARILMGLFQEHKAFGKLLYVSEGLALILMASVVYRRTRRDIERSVTTPIEPN